jgi:hypothetical protein
VLLIKTGAFCWNNNCVIINMHGKTTLKINLLELSDNFIQPPCKSCMLCPHSALMCVIWISEKLFIFLNGINWLGFFISETECIYFAVRTEYFNRTEFNFRFKVLIKWAYCISSACNGCSSHYAWGTVRRTISATLSDSFSVWERHWKERIVITQQFSVTVYGFKQC